MSRRLLGAVIAALVVLATCGSAGAVTGAARLITISGRLEYVSSPSVAHYEVADYVIRYNDAGLLAKLTGKDVLVTGTESSVPSIIMKKTLDVKQITAKSGDDSKVTIPVIPPTPPVPPGDNRKVTIPAIPPTPAVPPRREPIKVPHRGTQLPMAPARPVALN